MADGEKRRFRRVDFKKPVEFQTVEHDNSRPCLTRAATVSCDMSEDGLRLYTYDFIPLEREMTLHFYLSEDTFLKIPGKVIWIQKIPHGEMYQAGIRFVERAETAWARKELRSYIHSQK